jgi:predicted metal-dependent hydrolase
MIDDLLQIAGAAIPIKWRRNPNARRYILRFQRPPCVVATIPRGGSQRDAWAFIQRCQPWIERQLAKPIQVEAAWTLETQLWFRGQKAPIAELGDFPAYNFKNSVVRHLQKIACDELTARTRQLAAQTASQITRVSIRNQRTRWGSCSRRGTISLNWRLIQTPQFVVDYIILHELMHLRQMNHSDKFWREVESVCPTWRDAEAWIKRHGREIMN